MDDVLKDKRFAHVAKDPRFRKMPVGERKVKIDKRFKGMFKDKRFKLKYSVDKRGKPVNLTTDENLKKYYELSDQDTSDSEDDEDKNERHLDDLDSAETIPSEKNKKMKNANKDNKKSKQKTFTDKEELKESFSSDDSGDSSDLTTDTNFNRREKQNKVKGLNDPRFKTELLKPHKIKDRNSEKKGKEEDTSDNESDEKSSDGNGPEIDENFQIEESSDDEEVTKPKGNDSGVDFARGEGNIDSSSSDDDDDDDDQSDDDESDENDNKDVSKFDHKWGEADENIVAMEEATYRLAVCNMDWDRMKAKDIFVLLNSFKPADGIIKSVKVYPSEFGKVRMAEEAAHGPRELKELRVDSDEEEEDIVDEEGTTYHREKLREYQLNRLKYYYAVIECDGVGTADHIYKECDGMEYESSATKLDLRFIPDEETFNDDEVSSVCTEIPGNYKPQYFFNAALAQSKVDLTWDETDRDRVQLTTQQFSQKGDEGGEEDLKAYLASSSDEEGPDYGTIFGNTEDSGESEGESDEDKKLNKYKQLLTGLDSQEKKKKHDVEMEISWEPGLREATESIVKKKKQSKNSTVWEDYLQKKKEKKKKKIEERKKKKKSQDQESDDRSEDEDVLEGGVQAFSDDDLPVDEDMAAFMAEEKSTDQKKKKNKKKKKKKESNEEDTATSKEKAELSLLTMDEEDNKKHFNLRDLVQDDGKKKKKKKQKEAKNKVAEDDFQMNVSDPRFSAVYESHLFNIDPSVPEYRKTKGTEAMISEKIKRSGKRDRNRAGDKRTVSSREDEQVKKQKLTDSQSVNDDNLASLIKSVKSKTKHFHSNKSKR